MFLSVILLVALCLCARAELVSNDEAPDITKYCRYTLNGSPMVTRKHMFDRRYSTYATVLDKAAILIEGQGHELGGLFLQFYDRATPLRVQVKGGGSEWQDLVTVGTHLTDWVALPAGTEQVRLLNSSGSRLFLA